MPALPRVGLGAGAGVQVGAQPVVIECLVAEERIKIETGDQRFDTDAVMTLAGRRMKRTSWPSASTKAMIFVVRPPRERPTA